MNITPKHRFHIVAFLVIVLGLFLVDYQYERPGNNSFFLSSLIRDVFQPTSITSELLSQTSLKEKTIVNEEPMPTFFDPYLSLPEKTTPRRYSIEGTSLFITEIRGGNPQKLVQTLLREQKPDYQFNKINQGTFYLNQVPSEKKTHNFLGIIIKDTLYGFQYLPKEHPQVLEIIDALEQNE